MGWFDFAHGFAGALPPVAGVALGGATLFVWLVDGPKAFVLAAR
jgi:hypothetical protein